MQKIENFEVGQLFSDFFYMILSIWSISSTQAFFRHFRPLADHGKRGKQKTRKITFLPFFKWEKMQKIKKFEVGQLFSNFFFIFLEIYHKSSTKTFCEYFWPLLNQGKRGKHRSSTIWLVKVEKCQKWKILKLTNFFPIFFEESFRIILKALAKLFSDILCH